MNKLLTKVFPKVLHKAKFCFTQITYDNNVYKIGGIADNTEYSLNKGGKDFFGEDIIDGFENAYTAILEGFEQNDNDMLKENLSSMLMDKLKPTSLELINQKSSIATNISRVSIVFGTAFNRNESNNSVFFLNSKESCSRLGLSSAVSIGNPESFVGLNGVPILSIYEVYFKSAIKLIPKGMEADTIPETHMFQFEIENNISLQKLPSFMQIIKHLKSGAKNGKKMPQLLMEVLTGSDYCWKIGDVDKTLEGNLQIK